MCHAKPVTLWLGFCVPACHAAACPGDSSPAGGRHGKARHGKQEGKLDRHDDDSARTLPPALQGIQDPRIMELEQEALRDDPKQQEPEKPPQPPHPPRLRPMTSGSRLGGGRND